MFLQLFGQQEGDDGQGVYSIHYGVLPADNLPYNGDGSVIRIKMHFHSYMHF